MRYLIYLFFLLPYLSQSQSVSGIVLEKKLDGKTEVIVGANIRWLNAKSGVSSNSVGKFMLAQKLENHQMIVSFVGYKTDTLIVHTTDYLTVFLEGNTQLEGVTVRANATQIDQINPIHTEIINQKTLAKAACCNLSESFETNASISVNFTDAVTGAKQIQMLGLSGTYVQVNTENIPAIRGLATTFGLNFIPGTWITSIDVGKGAGSVVNGYEAMTGQINIELAKPETSEALYLNTYLNSFGRGEVNVNLAHKLNSKWSVGLLTHASTQQSRLDKNGDGFLDLPLFTQYNAINRWKYQGDKLMLQAGLKVLYENRLGGQSNFESALKNSPTIYGFGNTTKRVEFFSKTAWLFPEKPYKGIGLIVNLLDHQQTGYFGFKNYIGNQRTWYNNLIYQNIIGDTRHTYKAGVSFLYDFYDETYASVPVPTNHTELVPGAFLEYTYANPEKFTAVVGGRVDFHNLYGTRFTPRLHLKYDLDPQTQLRASVGKGWRVANPIAENFGSLASARTLIFVEKLNPEESWNMGGSLNHNFLLFGQKGTVILDYFRTVFQNQVVFDMESADLLKVYNLRGESFANSFQAEINYQPRKRMDLKLAYRFFDVQQSIIADNNNTLLPKPFVNQDRVLFNAAYATKWDKWKFDFTVQWNGKRRIPDFSNGHVHTANSAAVYAPSFFNINAQVTKTFKTWELYVGGENLNNFTQPNPILSANDPFGKNFDASMVWGPIIGRMVYTGMRYKIK